MRALALVLLAACAHAHAVVYKTNPELDEPARWLPRDPHMSFEQALCTDPEGWLFLDLVPDPDAATSRMGDTGDAIICRRGRCRSWRAHAGTIDGIGVNPDATIIAFMANMQEWIFASGKEVPIANPIDPEWHCGSGIPLDDGVVFVHGQECDEFGKKPFFYDTRTGKATGPYAGSSDGIAPDGFRFWKLAPHLWAVEEHGVRALVVDDRTGKAAEIVALDVDTRKLTLTAGSESKTIPPPRPCPPEDHL